MCVTVSLDGRRMIFWKVEYGREERPRSRNLAHAKVIDSDFPPALKKLMVFPS